MKKAPDTEGALSPFRGELGTIGISHVSVTFRNGAITRLPQIEIFEVQQRYFVSVFFRKNRVSIS